MLVMGVLSILLMLLPPRVMGIARPAATGAAPVALLVGSRRCSSATTAAVGGGLADQPGVVGAYLVSGAARCLAGSAGAGPARRCGRLRLRRTRPAAAAARHAGDLLDALLVCRALTSSGRAARVTGLHVDDNWHELGELRYDITTDVSLAQPACARRNAPASPQTGRLCRLPARLGHADGAGARQTPKARSLADRREQPLPRRGARGRSAEIVAAQASAQGKRVVVLAVGELGQPVPRCARPADDAIGDGPPTTRWNRRILKLIGARELDELQRQRCSITSPMPRPTCWASALRLRIGARSAAGSAPGEVYAYGPQYGSGAAVVRLVVVTAGAGETPRPQERKPMRQYRNYIAGEWVEKAPAASRDIDPADGPHGRRVHEADTAPCRRAAVAAGAAVRAPGAAARWRARRDVLPHRRRDRASLRRLPRCRDRRHRQARARSSTLDIPVRGQLPHLRRHPEDGAAGELPAR